MCTLKNTEQRERERARDKPSFTESKYFEHNSIIVCSGFRNGLAHAVNKVRSEAQKRLIGLFWWQIFKNETSFAGKLVIQV